VRLQIDENKRKIYALYHSGGHLLDVAIKKCGLIQLKPLKGYHYPNGAYVEYGGDFDNSSKDKTIEELNQFLD
jgi:Ser-tRNA(Ala) deacylase AlaX